MRPFKWIGRFLGRKQEVQPAESAAVANTTDDKEAENMQTQERMDENEVHAKVAKGTAMEHLPHPTHPVVDGGSMLAQRSVDEEPEAKLHRLTEEVKAARKAHKEHPTEANMTRLNQLEEEWDRQNTALLDVEGSKKH